MRSLIIRTYQIFDDLVSPKNGPIIEMVIFCLSTIFVGCVIQSSHITLPRSFGFKLFN